MRDSRSLSPRIQAPARSSGSGDGRSSSDGFAKAVSVGAETPPEGPTGRLCTRSSSGSSSVPYRIRQWSRTHVLTTAPSRAGRGVCATSRTTSPRERPRRRIRSVSPASISAPRAARPAGAATSRTLSVPSTPASSAGSDASQTVPRFAILAPRASRIAARISGSSLLPSPRLRRVMVHAVEKAAVQLLDRVVALSADQERHAELPELAVELAIAARAGPDREDRVLEGAGLRVRTEHHVEIADHRPEHVDLLVHDLEHVGLDRLTRGEVVDVHVVLLPQPVEAPDPLLDPHRIPRKVVIHEEPAELEVSPFASRLRAHENARAIPELGDGGFLLAQSESAVEHHGADPERAERARQELERGAELG